MKERTEKIENEWWNIVLNTCEAFDGDLEGLASSGITAGEKKAVKAMRRKLKDFERYAKTVVEM